MKATLRQTVRFEKARADSLLKLHGMILDRAARYLHVIKWDRVIGELLIVFVSFACDQHNVSRTGERNGAVDCLGAIDNLLVAIGSKAFFGFGDYCAWAFLKRIIRVD